MKTRTIERLLLEIERLLKENKQLRSNMKGGWTMKTLTIERLLIEIDRLQKENEQLKSNMKPEMKPEVIMLEDARKMAEKPTNTFEVIPWA